MLVQVLVVDDDEDIRDAVAMVLRDDGVAVQVVCDGLQALAWLHANPGAASVILLDLMMPVMDGRSFLEAKESDPSIASVAVVVVTAGGGCRQLRRKHKVQQCLHKPLSVDLLLQAVHAADMPPTSHQR
jgi:CheY-like chemotaxis protein